MHTFCCSVAEDSQQISLILKFVINLALVHWLDFGQRTIDGCAPRIIACIGEMVMNPTPHIKTPNPPLDLEVHIHKMVAKAFLGTFKIKGATRHVTIV
jgi:hypothetical protein